MASSNEVLSNEETKVMCVVKWFNSRKGYGFITNLEDNNDYFAHQSQLQPSENCFKTLYTGEYIECNIKKENDKFQAINITGIRGGKLMCEHRIKNEYNSYPSNNYSNNFDRQNRNEY